MLRVNKYTSNHHTFRTLRLVMDKVRPKKSLGQHFLHDERIAKRIVESLVLDENHNAVLELGPGMGVLTRHLMALPGVNLKLVEIDSESILFLKKKFPLSPSQVVEGDFLELPIDRFFTRPFSLIGNFPYNISSQIFFKALSHKNLITQIVGMLQKEVADRIAAPPGSKTYGILSVLLQAYYNVKILFSVPPGVFHPPPKVTSAVVRLLRNQVQALPCDEQLFTKVVKQSFNNRRKTLRNALKPFGLDADTTRISMFDKRAEQLSVADFVELTLIVHASRQHG